MMKESQMGEYPADAESIPAIIQFDEVSGDNGLEIKANRHLSEKPQLLEIAKARGHDVIAYSTRHGKVIAIGLGVAAFAAAVSGIILYKHHKK